MPTRRTFLRSAGLALAATGANPTLLIGRRSILRERTRTALPEVGLFFDAADLPTLRRRFADDPLFASLRERLLSIDRAEKRKTLRTEIRYNDHLYDIVTVHDVARDMAFVYAMTGDEDAADLSVEAVRILMRFSRWDYFLEAGEHVIGLQRAPETTLAVAYAMDWLGDAVDDAERLTWTRTMGERGCEPSYLSLFGMRHPDRVEGWTIDPTSTYFDHRPGDRFDLTNWPVILDETNLKAVPASALAVGALCHRHVLGATDEADRWLEQALYSLRSFGDLYAADGSYPEGVSYAGYTSNHLALATDALARLEQVDLFDEINWIGYGEFLREMSLPTTNEPFAIVNFGDAGQGATSGVPFWTASRASDGRAQWFGRTLAREHDEFSLFWYDPDVDSDVPSDRPHLWQSDLDRVVARTGYDASDLVVAMRSGGPANHEHADRNSIIVKAHGEILVADPYRPPYSSSDPAWMMRTTAGHSALLIDGQGHQYHEGQEGTNPSAASAAVVRAGERDGYVFWTSDASPAYRLVMPDVRTVTRSLIVLHDLPAVIVADKVVKEAVASTVRARFLAMNLDGRARITVRETGFRIMRPYAVLTVLCTSPDGADVLPGRLPIPDETAALHPYVDAATRQKTTAPFLVSVLVPTPSRTPSPTIKLDSAEPGIVRVHIEAPGGEAECQLFDTDAVPEFDVRFG